MRFAFLFVAALLFAAPAFAEEYEEGPNGGLMLDVAGIDAELLTSENTVTINVFDVKNAIPPPALPGFRGTTNLSTTPGRAVTVYRDTLSEGFSHFVTSMTAPVAFGWRGCRVGLAPTGKRRLFTAHAKC